MTFPLNRQWIEIGGERVQLLVPDEAVIKKAYENKAIPFPFWSRVWPAALGLSEYLMQYRYLTENKHVVEIGAGLGLPSLVAAHNAASVLCTDAVAEAVNAVQQTIELQKLTNIKATVFNWEEVEQYPEAGVLLLSDINYNPETFDHLQKMLMHYVDNETDILLSTPQRLMAKNFVQWLMPYSIRQHEVIIDKTAIAVIHLRKK